MIDLNIIYDDLLVDIDKLVGLVVLVVIVVFVVILIAIIVVVIVVDYFWYIYAYSFFNIVIFMIGLNIIYVMF